MDAISLKYLLKYSSNEESCKLEYLNQIRDVIVRNDLAE